MKKLLILITTVCMILAMVSCGNKTKKDDFVPTDVAATEESETHEKGTVVNPLGFENINLMKAVCNALGKEEKDLTQDDIESVKYFAIGPESTGECTVYIGLSDYIDAYFDAVNNPEDEILTQKLVEFVKVSKLDYDIEKDTFFDVAKFKNVNVFEYYDIPISDVSFLNELQELYFGYFKNNGIIDVSSLSEYNPVTLRELDFTGNNIQDWSYLEHIKEKVVVHYEMREYDNGNGEKIKMPVLITLENKMKQDAERKEQENNKDENQQKTPAFVDKDGNAVDFGSLFE